MGVVRPTATLLCLPGTEGILQTPHVAVGPRHSSLPFSQSENAEVSRNQGGDCRLRETNRRLASRGPQSGPLRHRQVHPGQKG